MYGIALRLTGSPTDADDVVQDASVRVWRALPQFAGRAALATWVHRITVNVALAHLARRRPASPPPVDDDVIDVGSDPAVRVEHRARLEEVAAALEALSDEQRTCVVLREGQGLTYEEIADVLDTSVAAVKGRLYRARQELIGTLDAFDAPQPQRSRVP